MDLLLNLLGLLLIVGIALLGIAGSGLLTAKRMAEMSEPTLNTDTPERNTES
ncbi:hypothetical protein [Leifsonia sp. PS1209]|uniref:hypothetical protein n=1 Tax=Leifsonia sp. PS1209 TaxID=2724914 RepID=UPI001442DF53|nr:hypothetical protein [Leifsonia sp. PS1209]QIZ97783.1 hypothetical protein HF024_04095 [Leifsonia sp. PS1209]